MLFYCLTATTARGSDRVRVSLSGVQFLDLQTLQHGALE
jgi:hypothetical protein